MSPVGKGSRTHVVIVGCGFAGLEAARRLAGTGVRLTLIDHSPHFIFRPLLSQLLAGSVTLASVVHPLDALARALPDTAFRQGSVQAIDFDAKQVVISGRALPYDYLVMATGTDAALSREAEPKGASSLDSVEHCRSLDRALVGTVMGTKESGATGGPRSIVVVGGGPHGVELAAAINTRLRIIERRAPPTMRAKVRVVLVHDGPRLLQTYPAEASSYAAEVLSRQGIEVLLGQRVQAGAPAIASVPAPTLVWATGRRAPRFAAIPALSSATLDADLSLRERPEVLIIGDLAVSNAAARVPGLASAAMQMGHHAALVVRADLSSAKRPSFSYVDRGYGTYVGPHDAVVVLGGRVLRGQSAFAAKMTLHMMISTASSVAPAATVQRGISAIRDRLIPRSPRGLMVLERTPPDSARPTKELRLESRVVDRMPLAVFDIALARVEEFLLQVGARVLERAATAEGYLRLHLQLGDWPALRWPIEVATDRPGLMIIITTLSTHPLHARATIQMRADGGDTVISQVNRYQMGAASSFLSKAVGLDAQTARFWSGFHEALKRAAF